MSGGWCSGALAFAAPESSAISEGSERGPRSTKVAARGASFAAGFMALPLALCGVLKIGYDLALWAAFRRHSRQHR